MEWNSTFIEDINRKRMEERKLAPDMARRHDNLLRLTSKSLYGEKVHYALELIQNAEDAESASITFIFEKNRVIVINDGEVFTPDDVEAICSVEPGRKKNKIGFFGVGFKSVFNITNTPQVISFDFNFQIENYICPKPVNQLDDELKGYYSRDKGSIFIFPQSEGLPTIEELIQNFKEIDDKILLFLNSLQALHFIDRINGEQWSIEKPPNSGSLVVLRNGRTGQTTKWMVFSKDLPVSEKDVLIPEGKEGITDTRILIAFPCDDATKEANKGSTVYCYLPTNKRSDMPFLVQGDFVPTVGRGNIQDLDWNRWLLKNLGQLAAESLEQLREDENLSKEIYNFIPFEDEVHESLMDILSKALYEALRFKKIARTLSLEWKQPSECAIPSNPEITNIIYEKDLVHLFGRLLLYTDVKLSDRARKILAKIGSSIAGRTRFIEFLAKEDLIKSRKPQWFLRVYAYLGEIFDVTSKWYDGSFKWPEEILELFSKLKKTKFILTNQGTLVPLEDPDKPDRLICYPQSIGLSEVNELFTEGELVFLNRYFQRSTIVKRNEPNPEEEERRNKAHEFFEGVGIKISFNQSHVIKDVILPKYSSGKYKEYDDLKLYRLVNYIRMYWSTLESQVKNKKISEKIFDELKQTVRMKAYATNNGEKVSKYLLPGQIYITERYGKAEKMEELFDGLEEIYFLHPYYLNREKNEIKKARRGRQKAEYSWKKFAEMLGVWSSPRVEKNENDVSIVGKKEYDWIERRHSPRSIHKIQGDSFSPDIQSLITFCSKLKDADKTRNKMSLLWESLSDNWKIYEDHCNATYKYFYNSEHYIGLNTSTFLRLLKNSTWVPTARGGYSKPEEVFLDNRRNRLLLGDEEIFVNLSATQTFLKSLGVKLEPTMDQVIEHLKDYKQNNSEQRKQDLEKCQEIYSFIAQKAGQEDLEKINKEFGENELLFIPRKDRSWWKPSLAFWRDYSKTFGPLRGYIEYEGKSIYPESVKGFLLSLGVEERPSIEHALDVLEQLREKNDTETLNRIVIKVYSYINDLLSYGYTEDVKWDEYSFYTRRGNFSHPPNVYYEDDEDLAKTFYEHAEFINLQFSSWVKLPLFLKSAGFKSFRENLTINKRLEAVSPIEGGDAASFMKTLNLARSYILKKNLDSFEILSSKGVFTKLLELEICETSKIELDLFLKGEGSTVITAMGVEKEAYYSEDENRLYILKGIGIFSEKVAKEISRAFTGAENDIFPFLNSVLPKVKDEGAFESQLRLFGIAEELEEYAGPEKVELIPQEGKPKKPEEEAEGEKKEGAPKEEEKKEEPKVQLPLTPKGPKNLIDPDEYIPSTVTEYTPYKKTEGEGPVILKQINLKEGKKPLSETPKEPPIRTGTKDAEVIALRIVMNYESNEGRTPEDRHKQKGIGYDIYSVDSDGNPRYIEVKHFSEQEGTFTLTPHQLEKAKQEGDTFYVYIVTGLKEGSSNNKLFIIQNPVKWLTADPPIEENYSSWKNAVQIEIDFEKI